MEKAREKARSIRKRLSDFWEFLWYSNSILSWILLFLIAFIIVKFIFFPLASLALSSKMPFVIVESYSMQHCHSISHNPVFACSFDEYWLNYGGWYKERDFNKEQFKNFSFKNGLDAGDIVIVKGKRGNKGENSYDIGDIIVFFANSKPIIHRIVNKTCQGSCVYETKGDNNDGQIDFEKSVTENQIVGKAIFVLPKLGWIKLLPFKIFGLA